MKDINLCLFNNKKFFMCYFFISLAPQLQNITKINYPQNKVLFSLVSFYKWPPLFLRIFSAFIKKMKNIKRW